MADRPKAGPTGEFPFGQPVDQTDRGGLHMAFRCIRPMRMCSLDFGTVVGYVNTTIPEVRQMIELFRSEVEKNWGKMGYNKAELPLKVSIIHGNLVQIAMPQPLEVLACNPEVILALCEVIEDRLREAGLTGITQ